MRGSEREHSLPPLRSIWDSHPPLYPQLWHTFENWNSANTFIPYGKGGEFASNKLEDQEILMLSLHLLQVSLVYVNTLMIQQVLAEPAWQGRLTLLDLRALSPLKWQHINPYGTFILNMQERLPLEQVA